MPKFIDITGQKFNRLVVNYRVKNDKFGNACWNCTCACGNIIIVSTGSLKSGHTKSCGCFCKDIAAKTGFIHGMSNTPEYCTWVGMIQRCTNPKAKAFKDYGDRGITVCNEWRNDFMAFFNDVGYRPSKKHTIERIDNNLGYSPSNTKWATRKEQSNNTRYNRIIIFNGFALNITQWAKKLNIKREILSTRIIKLKWSIEDAFYTPKNGYIKKGTHPITIHKQTMSITQWAKFVNKPVSTISTRIRRGWPPAKAIFTPVRHR